MTNDEMRKLNDIRRKIDHARRVRARLPDAEHDGFLDLTIVIGRYIDQYGSLTGGHY